MPPPTLNYEEPDTAARIAWAGPSGNVKALGDARQGRENQLATGGQAPCARLFHASSPIPRPRTFRRRCVYCFTDTSWWYSHNGALPMCQFTTEGWRTSPQL